MDAFFSDVVFPPDAGPPKVHVRVQQRTLRLGITTVEGLDNKLDLKKICRAMKKMFNCQGAVMHDEDRREIIRLQGDHRREVMSFLADQEIVDQKQLCCHGF